MGPLLLSSLADLVNGIYGGGGDRSSREKGGGAGQIRDRMVSGGVTRVGVRYEAHLPALSLRDGEKPHTIIAGAFLPAVQGHVICKNWHLCGLCWEYCEHKN